MGKQGSMGQQIETEDDKTCRREASQHQSKAINRNETILRGI